jgi:hypothetical protein
MNDESLDMMLTLLSARADWDAVLVQEGPKKDSEELVELDGGHLWFVAASGARFRSVAILSHRRWVSSVCQPSFSTADGRLAFVDVLMHGISVRLMTSHLPHGDRSDVEFDAALACLEEAVSVGRKLGHRIVVGIDANAIIGKQLENDSPRIVGQWGVQDRNERGVMFSAWSHSVRLAVCNTMFKKRPELQWTHQMWSSGARRQIDYILVDSCLRGMLTDAGTDDSIDFKSDHRCTYANLQIRDCAGRKRRGGRRTGNGRNLNAEAFHEQLDALVTKPPADAEALVEGLVTAAKACSRDLGSDAIHPNTHNMTKLQELMAARSAAMDAQERKKLTKSIWEHLRMQRAEKKSAKLDEILNAGKGQKELAKILKSPVKRKRTCAVTDADGRRCTDSTEIVEVFAQFYANLYDAVARGIGPWSGPRSDTIEPSEIRGALKKLRAGRVCGDDGLYAEILKTHHEGLITLIAQMFTDILHGTCEVPASWTVSRLVVLYKKGDASLPKNYRPIAIISVLSKLFSGVLLARIGSSLDSLQGVEQGGFRPDYSCSDIIMFMRMMAEKADEWGEEVWAASLDLEKAFDKVYHSSVLDSLEDAGVESDIISFLGRLYGQQKAYVCLDSATRSRLIDILRGVRQGDPMSPILFNNVTRQVFQALKEKWSREGRGSLVCSRSSAEKSTHAMFADDTTLFASNKKDLIQMIRDVQGALAPHGLNLNVEKCLIQTSRMDVPMRAVNVDGQSIPLVRACEGFKVLGTQWTLHGRTSAELRCRIGAAWAKFHALWPLLGKRDGNLLKKLRVFDASVTQTALWCCESWLLTVKEKRLLESTQNRMLRRIAGPGRRPEEPWVDWIKRSTRAAREHAANAGIRLWVDSHLKAKWCWAGHVLRMQPARLACRAATWRDGEWWRTEMRETPASLRYHRPHRTRWFRWEDELKKYALEQGWSSWQSITKQRDIWLQHWKGFVKAMKKK